ncbi:MAG: SufD family Fe-S cluster assembly protein, partial [Oscillospiraceae bacterium]|nr:SufD family Fe-S cluster assembly protein [Oscillospiraceae bacterium]
HTECDSIIMDGAKIVAIPSLEANCVDAQLVHEAAVGIVLPAQLLEAEARMIGGGQKHVADLILRQLVDMYLEALAVGQGDGGYIKVHVRGFDPVLIHNAVYPGAKGRHVKAAVSDHINGLGQQLLPVVGFQLPLKHIFKGLRIHAAQVDNLRQADVAPAVHGALQIAHGHQGAVERTDRSARHCVILYAGLIQCLPHTDLVRTLGPAALEGNGIGFAQIELQLHIPHSLYVYII